MCASTGLWSLNKNMRGLKFLFILLCFSGAVAYGQKISFNVSPKPVPRFAHKQPVKKPVHSKRPVRLSSEQLAERVKTTYRRAKKMQDRYPEVIDWGGPSKRYMPAYPQLVPEAVKFANLNPQILYPHLPALSSEQLAQCFLIQHNLELVKWMPKQEELRQYVEEHIPLLQKHQVKVSVAPTREMTWLARQVTPETQYLLLGEIHAPEIGNALPDLLRELRRTQKDRPIFLFTEFLPERQEWGHLDVGTLYFPNQEFIWNTAYVQRIPVIGLEPHFIYQTQLQLMERDPFHQGRTMPGNNIWQSLAGVRMRNQHWMPILQEYRAQYPDALFIVYAGNAHVSYSEPYSIANRLSKQNTLVALLYPEQDVWRVSGKTSVLTSKFDAWTNGKFVKDNIVQFDLPVFSRIVGFDIRIRIPGTVLTIDE